MAAKQPTPTDPADFGGVDPTEIVFEVKDGPYVGPYVDDGDFEIVRPQEGAGLFTRTLIEALGTFALVLVILGTALYLQVSAAEVAPVAVALAAGLVLAALIGGLGHVSGGHFNPAVSLGAALGGHLAWLDMLAYWVAQVVGGLVAAAILWVTLPSGVPDNQAFFATAANGWAESSPLSTMTQGGAAFDLRAALILEIVATAIFVGVTLGVVHRRAVAAVGPFAVGFALAAMLLVTGLATGGGLNPARSTAAAFFSGSGALGQLWLFWLAPLVGAALAGLVYVAFTGTSGDDDFEAFEDGDEVGDIRLSMPASAGTPTGAPGTDNNVLAILALVFGLLGGGVVAVVLGHLARAQIRRTGERGDGMAIAGLVLGYVGLTLLLVYLVAVVGVSASLN